jgi:superfamily II RNA helicase
MTKQRKLLNRLAIREKITAMARAETIRTLDEEINKITSINEKLEQMAIETQIKTKTTTMMALRSAQHYGGKIHEQMKVIENRVKFLEEERLEEAQIMGQALTRQKHATEKSRQRHILDRDEKEEKAATDVPRVNSTSTAGR